jgi:hypothetical protein
MNKLAKSLRAHWVKGKDIPGRPLFYQIYFCSLVSLIVLLALQSYQWHDGPFVSRMVAMVPANALQALALIFVTTGTVSACRWLRNEPEPFVDEGDGVCRQRPLLPRCPKTSATEKVSLELFDKYGIRPDFVLHCPMGGVHSMNSFQAKIEELSSS